MSVFLSKYLTNDLICDIIQKLFLRRGGRVVEGATLEMLWGESLREFESHPLLQKKASILIQDWCFFQRNKSFQDLWNTLWTWNIAPQCEIRLTACEDLFHFTESDSFLFHNFCKKLSHINKVDISLITIPQKKDGQKPSFLYL